MKYIFSILIFVSILGTHAFSETRTNLTPARKRETAQSILSFYSYNNRRVNSIWNHRVYKCEPDEDCLFFVDSNVEAQYNPHPRSGYGTYDCRTLIHKEGRKLRAFETFCDLLW